MSVEVGGIGQENLPPFLGRNIPVVQFRYYYDKLSNLSFIEGLLRIQYLIDDSDRLSSSV